MDNSPVYLKSIKIYQWIFAIFGLNLPPSLYVGAMNPLKRYLIFITYVVYCATLFAVAVYTTYSHNIMVHVATIQFQLDSVIKILSYIQNVAMVVVLGVTLLNTLLQYKDLHDISSLIEQLEYEMLSQNTRKRTSMKWKLWRVSGLCLMFFAVILVYLIYFMVVSDLATQVKVIVLFFIMVMQLKLVEYRIYIQIVYELIDCVWQSLASLKADMEAFPRSAGQTMPWSLVWQLTKNQQLLNRVWFLVSRIEQYFAGPIFVLLYYNGIAIMSTVNWAYVRYIYELKHVNQSLRLIYILILLGNLLTVCCLTEKCMQRYRSIASLLQTFKLQSQDCEVLIRLREYSMQLVHQNLKFTCNDYMDVDFKSYGKMILVIAAYVIVLVQFKMEDDSKAAMISTQKIFGNKM